VLLDKPHRKHRAGVFLDPAGFCWLMVVRADRSQWAQISSVQHQCNSAAGIASPSVAADVWKICLAKSSRYWEGDVHIYSLNSAFSMLETRHSGRGVFGATSFAAG